MNSKLRVLIVEDRATDAELIVRELRRSGYQPEWKRVETEPDYLAQLDQGWEIILADYSLPQFGGPRALELLQEHGLDIPLILVSGTVGEDKAVASMKAGASDHVMKDKLARLGAAVERELREAAGRHERKGADAELRRLRKAIAASGEAVFLTDRKGIFTFVNPGFTALYGHAAAEVVGKFTPRLLKGGAMEPEFYDRFWATLLSGQEVRAELRNKRKDGTLVDVATSANPILDGDGHILGFLGIQRDITERKRNEALLAGQKRVLEMIGRGEALRETLTALLQVVEAQSADMPCSICLLDADGTHLRHGAAPSLPADYTRALDGFANGGSAGSYGAAAFRGEAVFVEDIASGPLWVEHRELALRHGLRACWSTPIFDVERRVLGSFAMYSRRPALPSAQHLRLIEMATQTAAIAISRLEAEAALRKSEARYRTLFDRNLAGVYRATPAGRILECNDAFARIFGYGSRDDLLGTSPVALYPTPAAREAFVEVLETERIVLNHEFEGRGRDGQTVWLLENAHLVAEPGAGEVIEGTLVDVTAHKTLEAQLQQAHKLEAIGQLAGGVAHDFNNILGVILGYGTLALRDLGSEHPVHSRIDQMLKAAERAARLTRQLLAFSRKQVMQPKLLDINRIVAETHKMLSRLIGEHIAIVVRPAPGLGTVNADPGQIEQIILNLALNARDAMPKGGSLTLETANVDLDEDYCAAHRPATPGRYVMLAISDTGVGMDAETQDRIFEPFFTTKPEGEGTGLGLATVYGIVKQSGGYIWVYSEPGRGTTFKVYLARVDEPADNALAAGPPAERSRGNETILLVEDTAPLREVTREMLEESGYTVLLASDGEQALARASEREGPIHLLLTDVVMPKLGGGDLAERLSALRPAMRVLYMSGHTSAAISHHGVFHEGVRLLEKPFNSDELARALRETLDRPTTT